MVTTYGWEECITGNTCHYCGCVLLRHQTPKNSPFYEMKRYGMTLISYFGLEQIDHKIPVSKGGTNDPENLLISCAQCNNRKSARDYDEFILTVERRPCPYTIEQLRLIYGWEHFIVKLRSLGIQIKMLEAEITLLKLKTELASLKLGDNNND